MTRWLGRAPRTRIDAASGRKPVFIHDHRFAADPRDAITRMPVEYLKDKSDLSERETPADAASSTSGM